MGVILKKGKYFIDYRVQGRRVREGIGTNKREAELALAVRKTEIVQGRYSSKGRPLPSMPASICLLPK
jgi:hypothetical protein